MPAQRVEDNHSKRERAEATDLTNMVACDGILEVSVVNDVLLELLYLCHLSSPLIPLLAPATTGLRCCQVWGGAR